jgi:hypothetical protein
MLVEVGNAEDVNDADGRERRCPAFELHQKGHYLAEEKERGRDDQEDDTHDDPAHRF